MFLAVSHWLSGLFVEVLVLSVVLEFYSLVLARFRNAPCTVQSVLLSTDSKLEYRYDTGILATILDLKFVRERLGTD